MTREFDDDLPEWKEAAQENNEENDNDDSNDEVFIPFGKDDSSYEWVVGIYNGPNHVRFVRVPNRKAQTMTTVIKKYVAEGTAIHTDEWLGCNDLKDNRFTHLKVIHKENYVDPYTDTHSQGAERT